MSAPHALRGLAQHPLRLALGVDEVGDEGVGRLPQ
jgi:hypothetical protein